LWELAELIGEVGDAIAEEAAGALAEELEPFLPNVENLPGNWQPVPRGGRPPPGNWRIPGGIGPAIGAIGAGIASGIGNWFGGDDTNGGGTYLGPRPGDRDPPRGFNPPTFPTPTEPSPGLNPELPRNHPGDQPLPVGPGTNYPTLGGLSPSYLEYLQYLYDSGQLSQALSLSPSLFRGLFDNWVHGEKRKYASDDEIRQLLRESEDNHSKLFKSDLRARLHSIIMPKNKKNRTKAEEKKVREAVSVARAINKSAMMTAKPKRVRTRAKATLPMKMPKPGAPQFGGRTVAGGAIGTASCTPYLRFLKSSREGAHVAFCLPIGNVGGGSGGAGVNNFCFYDNTGTIAGTASKFDPGGTNWLENTLMLVSNMYEKFRSVGRWTLEYIPTGATTSSSVPFVIFADADPLHPYITTPTIAKWQTNGITFASWEKVSFPIPGMSHSQSAWCYQAVATSDVRLATGPAFQVYTFNSLAVASQYGMLYMRGEYEFADPHPGVTTVSVDIPGIGRETVMRMPQVPVTVGDIAVHQRRSRRMQYLADMEEEKKETAELDPIPTFTEVDAGTGRPTQYIYSGEFVPPTPPNARPFPNPVDHVTTPSPSAVAVDRRSSSLPPRPKP
jgi:hypothetical protein